MCIISILQKDQSATCTFFPPNLELGTGLKINNITGKQNVKSYYNKSLHKDAVHLKLTLIGISFSCPSTPIN